MASTLLIVDDNEKDRFTFTGDWNTEGGPGEYQQTTHATSKKGATASFAFNGSYVEVVGTVGLSGNVLTTSTYTIDGKVVGTFTAPSVTAATSQHRFFAGSVPDGQHTLLITVTSDNATYWLDYVAVGTSAKSIGPSDTILLDDSVSNVQYDGSWSTGGADKEVNQTTHVARTKGANAQLSFTGTHILVAGTIRKSESAQLSFYMDGVAAGTYTVDSNAIPDEYLYQHTLFEMDVPDGDHKLLITLTSDTYRIWLDYFLAKPGKASVQPSGSASISGSGANTPTGLGSSNDSSSSGTPVGAIAGGVVGGVVVLAALLGFFLFWRRRKRNRSQHMPTKGYFDTNDQTTTSFLHDASPSEHISPPMSTPAGSTILRYNPSSALSSSSLTSPPSFVSNPANIPSMLPPITTVNTDSSSSAGALLSNKMMREQQRNTGYNPRSQHHIAGEGTSSGSSHRPNEEYGAPPPEYSEQR